MEPTIYTERLKALRKHLKQMTPEPKEKRLQPIELYSNNDNQVEIHLLLFPIWLLDEMPFIYIDYPHDDEERNPLEIFIDFFGLDDQELSKYFNNVTEACKMANYVQQVIADRIYNDMHNH